MADPIVDPVVDTGSSVEGNWEYHDKHVTDVNVKDNILSSARCIIYARKSGASDKNTFKKIGIVQGYNWSEQRQIEQIFELGSDVPYLIPGRTSGQISLSRVLLTGKDLANICQEGQVSDDTWYRSLRDIGTAMDLLFVYFGGIEGSVAGKTSKYTRLFQTCWINGKNESLSAGQTIVAENVNIMYEFVLKVDITPSGIATP